MDLKDALTNEGRLGHPSLLEGYEGAAAFARGQGRHGRSRL
jgi:hypothetical protein